MQHEPAKGMERASPCPPALPPAVRPPSPLRPAFLGSSACSSLASMSLVDSCICRDSRTASCRRSRLLLPLPLSPPPLLLPPLPKPFPARQSCPRCGCCSCGRACWCRPAWAERAKGGRQRGRLGRRRQRRRRQRRPIPLVWWRAAGRSCDPIHCDTHWRVPLTGAGAREAERHLSHGCATRRLPQPVSNVHDCFHVRGYVDTKRDGCVSSTAPLARWGIRLQGLRAYCISLSHLSTA